MQKQLTEEDLEKIFISSKSKRQNPFLLFLKFFGLFILFFVIIFLALNFSAYWQKISFWYRDEFLSQNPNSITSIISGSDLQQTEIKSKIPNISDNSILIESIGVRSPVTFWVGNGENEILQALKNGPVQLQGTALPGEAGNVFITGHSSNYPWVRSNYNSIFSLLNKVVVGDAVLVKFQNQNYIYKVRDISIVSPSDTAVMDSKSSESILTLMTCSPVGTNLKRLIVVANQVYPDPATNRAFLGSVNKNLPKGVR